MVHPPFNVLAALLRTYWPLSRTLFMCIKEASSDERVLETATFLRMVPLGPVKPAWRDPFKVIR